MSNLHSKATTSDFFIRFQHKVSYQWRNVEVENMHWLESAGLQPVWWKGACAFACRWCAFAENCVLDGFLVCKQTKRKHHHHHHHHHDHHDYDHPPRLRPPPTEKRSWAISTIWCWFSFLRCCCCSCCSCCWLLCFAAVGFADAAALLVALLVAQLLLCCLLLLLVLVVLIAPLAMQIFCEGEAGGITGG